jgi:hypothetical protein
MISEIWVQPEAIVAKTFRSGYEPENLCFPLQRIVASSSYIQRPR